MAKIMVSNLDLEYPVYTLERVNKSIAFLSNAIEEYPHTGSHEEIATILQSLSDTARNALNEIEKMIDLE